MKTLEMHLSEKSVSRFFSYIGARVLGGREDPTTHLCRGIKTELT